MFCMMVGTFCSFCLGHLQSVRGQQGRTRLAVERRPRRRIRNLYFRPNGSFRRYGRVALLATLSGGSAALYWML